MRSDKQPHIGDIVHYTAYSPNPERSGFRVWPAIIVNLHPDDRADLQVFTSFGIESRALVPHMDFYQSDSWSWPKHEEEELN